VQKLRKELEPLVVAQSGKAPPAQGD
jgi:hypothetical protein